MLRSIEDSENLLSYHAAANRNIYLHRGYTDAALSRTAAVQPLFLGSLSRVGVGFLGILPYYCILSLFYVFKFYTYIWA